MKRLYVLFIFTLVVVVSYAQDNDRTKAMDYIEAMGEVNFEVLSDNPVSVFQQINRIVSVDKVDSISITAYANEEQFYKFLKTGLKYKVLTPASMLCQPDMLAKGDLRDVSEWDFYPTYEAYVELMWQFAADYPDLCEVVSIDTLASGRELLFVHINNDLTKKQNEPEFMYTSSMHGNEVTGYVLMLHLIDYLLKNYGTDSKVTNLVDNIDIWINPLANPDGTYQMGNHTVYGATRFNAFGVDLNRNYPDPDDGPHPDGKVYQSETKAFMKFAEDHNFVMSANFHGGSEVVNYPWDTWHKLTADDDWWRYVAREYADTAQVYSEQGYLTQLDDGITNGYAWYTITGGRQDYMNYFEHCREVTIEISIAKTPQALQLPVFWEYNYRALLNYMEQVLYGVHGVVKDAKTNKPIVAKIVVEQHDKDNSFVYSALPVGNYYRLLKAGDYQLTYSAEGYHSKKVAVSVADRQATVKNVYLEPVVGIGEKESRNMTVFPNPAENVLFVRSNKDINNLDVIDVSGKVVLHFSHISDSFYSVNISELNSGIYFVRMENVFKMIVKQ